MRASPFVSFSRRAVIWPALLAIAACSGGGGGGMSTPVAAADSYVFQNTIKLTVAAPGVLSNDSGGSLTAVKVGSPSNGTLVLRSDGSFDYTSNDGISTDAFSYEATNANGSSSVVQVNLAPNQPPAPVNACLPTPAGASLNGTLTATDEPASQPDTYLPVTDPTVGPYKGVVTINPNGTFTYTPNVPVSGPTYVGMDKFKFQVKDALGATSTGIATVLINGAVRIMPLGDSITEGVWYTDPSTICETATTLPDSPWLGNCPASGVRVSYRMKLYNDLEAMYPSLQALNANYGVNLVGSIRNGVDAGLAQPFHEGHAGYSASQIASGISFWLTSNPPDIILVHIGTNSFTTSATDVQTTLNNINAWAQSYYSPAPAGSRPVTVFVARIIQAVDGSQNVTAFNDNVATMITSNTSNWPYLTVTMVDEQTSAGLNYTTVDSTNHPECFVEGGNTACTAGDMASNLHPNPNGYAKMANRWKADIQTALPTCP